MAVIRPGPLFIDIRGRVGNNVFSIWRSGVHVVKALPAIVENPNSAAQVVARQSLQNAIEAYWHTLTSAQRAGWNAQAKRDRCVFYAKRQQGGIFKLVPPVCGHKDGENVYIGCRSRAENAGHAGPFDNNAPIGLATPTPSTGLAVAWNEVTDTVTLTWTDPVGVPADSRLRVWMRSRDLTYHRQMLTSVALGVQTLAILAARSDDGNYIAFADSKPQRFIFQMDCVTPRGLQSAGSVALELNTPNAFPGGLWDAMLWDALIWG